MALFINCRGLLKVNTIPNWRSSSSLTVSWNYLLCTNKNLSVSRRACDSHWLLKWPREREKDFAIHRAREGYRTHRCFSSESNEPSAVLTDTNKLKSKVANETVELSEDLDISREQEELNTDGIPIGRCETTHLSDSEIKPQDPNTTKDFDLTQLLENIQQAQLKGSLSVHKTVLDTQQTEFRTTPMTVDELVEFLRIESAQDMCVINIPPERDYVKYFVTCTGRGVSHIRRMADSLVAEVCMYAV